MAVHNWSQVDAGTFHAFHTAWITHLSEALNGGVLPSGYYALPEQHVGRFIADVLTLQAPMIAAPAAPRGAPRTLTIRHVSGNRIVALVEIVSPTNKDRRAHVEEFIDKAEITLSHGIHLLLVDLFPVAYVEHLAVGSFLTEMPLFLNPDRYVNVPLEATYTAAFHGLPAFLREILEGRQAPQP